MDDFVTREQSVQANDAILAIAGARTRLAALGPDLEGLFLGDALAEDTTADDADDSALDDEDGDAAPTAAVDAASAAASLTALAAEVHAHLLSACADAAQALSQAGKSVEERLADGWSAVHEPALQATAALESAARLATHDAAVALAAIDTVISGLHAGCDQVIMGRHQAFEGLDSELTGPITEQLNAAAEHVLQDLATRLTTDVQNSLATVSQMSDAAFQALAQAAQTAAQTAARDLEVALRNTAQMVSDDLRSQLNAATQQLINEALRALADAIAVSIVSAEIGSNITAAMAPVLPEIIALYAITGAIRQLIELSRDPFGGLF